MKVLITGATSGIGAALAELLKADGHHVIPVGRQPDSPVGPTFQADLATPEGRQIVADLIAREQPDVVVNNAGVLTSGPAVDHTLEMQRQLIEINIVALQELTLAAAHTWLESGKQGTVVNIGSVASFAPGPYAASYSASKAYVLSFSLALDEELRGTGIKILVSCPGFVRTHLHERAGTRINVGRATGMVMSAEYAARKVQKQLSRRCLVLTFSPVYKIIPLLARLLPRRWLLRLSGGARARTYSSTKRE